MSSLQSLSEDRCKENTFLFCEASITLISKSEKHKKRKLQTCLSHEHRCKNPQKYIRKSNLPMYQIRSVAQSCLTLCDPMNRSLPGLPVHHQVPEFTQTHVHQVSDAIQPSHRLSSPSPLAPNPSQHQTLFQ